MANLCASTMVYIIMIASRHVINSKSSEALKPEYVKRANKFLSLSEGWIIRVLWQKNKKNSNA